MKLTVKLSSGVNIDIDDLEKTDTIDLVKAKLHEFKPNKDLSGLNLIFAGKTLENEHTIEDYNI